MTHKHRLAITDDGGKHLLAYVLLTLATTATCSAAETVREDTVSATTSPGSTPLEHPLLIFEVVEIPCPGVAEKVSGVVEILEKRSGWGLLSSGVQLLNGTKLRIDAGARLTVRFSPTEQAEFHSAEKERWVVLEVRE